METWQNIAAAIVGILVLYYTFNKKRTATVQVVVVVALLGAAYYLWFYKPEPKQHPMFTGAGIDVYRESA